MTKLIGFVFEVEDDVSQMIKAVAEDALGSTPMLFELERLDLVELLARQNHPTRDQ